jgi:hypothetical protein
LLKAEKKVKREKKREKKKNNYRLVWPPCCGTCKNSRKMSVEGDIECLKLANDKWEGIEVYCFGLCDKYASGETYPAILQFE